MTTGSRGKHLGLTVSNFGPIAEASIELRPMSVFVGPSNTGKSYMAALIYALHRFFGGYLGDIAYLRMRGEPYWSHQIDPPQGYSLSKSDIADLYTWIGETIPHMETAEQGAITQYELPESIAALVRPLLNSVAHLSRDLESEIARCFGVNKTKNLARYPGDGGTGFSLHGNTPAKARYSDPFGYKVTMTERGTEIDASIPNTMPLRIDHRIPGRHLPWRWIVNERGADDVEKENIAFEFLSTLAREIASVAVHPLSRPAYYLPAGRAGVMHAHHVVVRALIASASRAALRPDSPMPLLSGVLGDFLEQLVELASIPHQANEEYDNLAQNLEQTLLRGSVHVEQSRQIDYPSFVYRPEGWMRDLPLMNASSMVSELAPVVLYLRHVVQPGDLLIIEEPESHLHPEMQAAFARQLVAAVQSGIRILITTHSEWILEELANLVRMSELPIDRREGLEDEGISLSPDQLGAWFFEPNQEEGGTVVREMSLDLESATFPAGFGLVTESLYNRWVEIAARIQEE